MSNERHTDNADGIRDDRVSRAYEDLATERAPEHLNQAVLHEAGKAAQPAYKRYILWTRPVAWAAVVAICLAITLQVTQLPAPGDIPELGELQRDDRSASKASSAADDIAAPEAAQAELRRSALKQTSEQFASDAPDTQPAAPAATMPEEAPVPLPGELDMQDTDMLHRAEEMVRQRAGENREAEHVALGTTGFAPATASASLEVASCSDEDRQDPEDWLVCIVLLEREGRTDEATVEREQLAEAFPDFELPARTE